MMRLVFPGEGYTAVATAMLSFPDETCMLLLAEPAGDRLIVVERHPAPDNAYFGRGRLSASLKPEFIVPIVKAARDRGLSVVFAHTHPADKERPQFSSVDDDGEVYLASFVAQRVPGVQHLALVISPGGCRARVLGSGHAVEVQQIGPTLLSMNDDNPADPESLTWDRQVRAFGREGQARIRNIRTAIVGCGGTGSLVAQQLAHLGVGSFVLIDPDIIERTNLNRVVGASLADVGRPKVDVTADMIRGLGLGGNIEALQGDVRDAATARVITGVDAIISCTDSHSSRAVVNQLAYQYVIPAFDVGVSIGAENEKVRYIAGRAQMLAPGLACLVCSNTIDAGAVRRELQSEEQLARDPYIVGHSEPQPAVISINSTMSSLLVTMFLAAFAGVPSQARLQLYDGIQGRVRSAVQKPVPGCIVCSSSGALAKVGRWPLPTRVAQ